jgi:hypothetical protein
MRSTSASAVVLITCAFGVLSTPWLFRQWRAQMPIPVTIPQPMTTAPEVDLIEDAPPSEARTANHVWSDDHGEVWVVGNAGRIWRSRDHGQAFVRMTTPVREDFVGMAGRRDGPVIVATEHALYRSRDAGASWTKAVSIVPKDQDTPAGITGLYSDGSRLWITERTDGESMNVVSTMKLEGNALTRLPEEYDKIQHIVGRRGAVLLLTTVYDCHSGDYAAVERLRDGGGAFERVDSGDDAFADSEKDITAAWMTPGGALYLLGDGDESSRALLRRERGERTFHSTPVEAAALWAGDDGEVFITTDKDQVRRSEDHGDTFGAPVELP